ncbi:MAG: 3-oxoacyl-ACP reductase [Verrucomicrobiales bacterium]|jgi:short-subunit dehydrogenase|nr:3-oxoacyl-ACP reductase [Verrucomicrobiales bacterium]
MRAGNHRVILITGATTGLGLALARDLIARGGVRLILTARAASLSRFKDQQILPADDVWLRPLDVTNEYERQAVIDEANARWNGVDVLINNAGIAYRSVVEHFTEQDDRDEMSVNFNGPMELIRLVLPGMRQKRGGRIISISSVGGMMAMPTMALYSASKFALEGACEALWYEVRPWKIKVSLVEPGFIRSEGFTHTRYTTASAQGLAEEKDAYHTHYLCMGSFIEKLMKRSFATPESVARTIIRTIERNNPPLRVPATMDAILFRWMRRFLPQRAYHAILYAALPGIRNWGKPFESSIQRKQLWVDSQNRHSTKNSLTIPKGDPEIPRGL